MLEVIAGKADSITVEPLGELGEGAEFAVRRGGGVELHQVKRQIRNANEWTLGSLREKGVLRHASRHTAMRRDFHFASMVPSQVLKELADRARGSTDVTSFAADLAANKKLHSEFKGLSADVDFGSELAAWESLRRVWVHWPDEQVLLELNAALAAAHLEGLPPEAAILALGEIASTNLGRELDVAALDVELAKLNLHRIKAERRAAARDKVDALVATWTAGVEAELLDPAIPRLASGSITEALGSDGHRVVFVAGHAGSGKTAVLYQVATQLQCDGWIIAPIRLDRLEPFASTAQLGALVDLGASPVVTLARAAAGGKCVLIIDQLDAVSRASGRAPGAMDVIAALVQEAEAFPEMRVVLACRKFDIDNDARIRHVSSDARARQIDVPQLADDDVAWALEAIGTTAETLEPRQRQLLRTPLNLKLFCDLTRHADAPLFNTSKDLLDAYWERKLEDCKARYGPSFPFVEIIDALVESLNARQHLSTPISVLDTQDLLLASQQLTSENILVRTGGQVAFFHESFFDYAFARRWLARNVGLVDFLVAGEQELFRRTQVRQVLLHLRDFDLQRFVGEVERLLDSPQVRFHIKDVVVSLLRLIEQPTAAESSMIARLVDQNPTYLRQLGQGLRNAGWFTALDAEGALEDWLASDEDQVRATGFFVLTEGVSANPDRAAEILTPYLDRETHRAQITWVLHFSNVGDSRALFEFVLQMVQRGHYDTSEHDLWLLAAHLPAQQPSWVIELLDIWLTRCVARMDPMEGVVVTALKTRDGQATEVAMASAQADPIRFCRVVVPHLLGIMARTAYPRDHPPYADRHFAHWRPGGEVHDVDDGLIEAAVVAVRLGARQDAEALRPVLELLEADDHAAAQMLLYQAFAAAPEQFADWAGKTLLQGDHRLECGYDGASMWLTRELLLAVSPFMADTSFTAIEERVRDLRFPWEGRPGPPAGFYAFTLLTGLAAERLSEQGRRRLEELRRLFGAKEPTEPLSTHVSTIVSPIPPSAVRHMSNANWLQAIAKYDADRADYTTHVGGAVELAHMLKGETTSHPDRFAKLALLLTPDHHPAYAENLLIGLADATKPVDISVVCDAIRHIASLAQPSTERWLAYPLRRHLDGDIPDDIIELVLDRALHAPDPTTDVWSRSTSSDDRRSVGETIYGNGINVARGQAVEMLGDLLVHDADGHRTALIEPHLLQLAADPSVAVRSCTAHLIGASLRHARPRAIEAFAVLVETDDRLLATHTVERLTLYITNGDGSDLTMPVIRRMLTSPQGDVRKVGGRFSAYLALRNDEDELLQQHRSGPDPAIRRGIAEVTADLLTRNLNVPLAMDVLSQLFNDADATVREAAAGVAAALRGQRLRPFRPVLTGLIDSAALVDAQAQLLITLGRAPDRVDDLVMHYAQRFVALHGDELASFALTSASDTQQLATLLVRAYAQSANTQIRRQALDLFDQLLLLGVYGVQETMDTVERDC
ncbi:ATP-binding protein [Actinokineospora sp. UTMC 2448]|uniref:AAA family ATPase n=1 Tax=Actinokineospora sp. UTMC 2448 TaxID=2268449 RepID=UPI0021642AB1|nr:ATP-binding protein [Actinokineospora sp. UTMC 2448]